MTALLLRLFVKDHRNTQDAAVRAAYGNLSGIVGIVCNLFLFASKLAIGILSGSISITADAVNNLSDAGSSIVTLVGFRLSSKPADDEHPFGHARAEYLTGLVIAGLILFIGFELAKSSVSKIIHPEPVEFSVALVAVLLISILMKLWMALFNRSMGKRIDSSALLATSADSRNDVISTSAVLLSCILSHYLKINLDGFMGLVVAVFILWSGIGIAKETIEPLLGRAPDSSLIDEIRDHVNECDQVLGVHDLMVHDYGPGKRYATVHVELDSRLDPLQAHDLLDNIERTMLVDHGIHLTIHHDPQVTNDRESNALQKKISELIQDVDPELSIHDFRMVREDEHTHLVFDLAMPYRLEENKQEIKQCIDDALKTEDTLYLTDITYDSTAFNPK